MEDAYAVYAQGIIQVLLDFLNIYILEEVRESLDFNLAPGTMWISNKILCVDEKAF